MVPFYQYRPSSNARHRITYGLSLLLVLVLAPRVFLPVSLDFLLPQKQQFKNFSSGGSEQRASTLDYWCYCQILFINLFNTSIDLLIDLILIYLFYDY